MTQHFRYLRYYSVSELLIAVYPSGNPMTCSAVSGTGYRWPSTRLHQSCQLFRSGFGTPRRGDCLPPLNAVALGVGHNPNSVANLSGTSVGSWYAMPFSIIPDRGQASENSAKPPSKQSCDVLHDDDSRSYFANEAIEVEPEAASCAVKTFSSACKTDILAGKSSTDSIRLYAVCVQSVCGKCSNIVINRYPAVASAQSCLRFSVKFTERDGLEAASPLQTERESADAAEQIEDAQLRHAPTPNATSGRCAGIYAATWSEEGRRARTSGAHVPSSFGSTSPFSMRRIVVSLTSAILARSARDSPAALRAGSSERGLSGSIIWTA